MTTRTLLLLAGLTALFLMVGFLLAGRGGAILALVLAGGMNAFAYWFSDSMILRQQGVIPLEPGDPNFGWLVRDVAALAGRAGLPMPKVYLIPSDQPNAFATGRDPEHAAVAASTGLLRSLSREETAGVMAHELAHIENRDTLTMAIAATLAGAVGMLGNIFAFGGGRGSDGESRVHPLLGLLLLILAPIAAMLVQFAISRTREYAADRRGGEICGQPLALASALAKIEAGARSRRMPMAEAHPATAHLFIINPLRGRALAALFSTHPPTAERIQALQAQAGSGAGRGSFPFSR